MEYKRKIDEELREYQIRLCRNKDLYDLRWEDISELWFEETGEKKSPDTFRKFWRYYNEGYEDASKQSIDSDEVLNEYELIKIETEKERKKLQSVKVEYNKLLREDGRRDLMFEFIKDSIERLPVPQFQPMFNFHKDNKKAGVLSFGDIHFGKQFKSLNNEYNIDIAKKRMEQLIPETVAILGQHGFQEIDVINGADSIEGMSLRVSQLQSLQIGFIDQTIQFSKLLASWLNELSKYVKVRYHHLPSANHSEIRPHNSGRGEFPAEDLERVIMHYVHDVLENNPRVEIPIYEKGIIELDVLGYNIAALHGHQLRGKKNIIPELSVMNRKFYDYLYIAHYHHGSNLTVAESDSHNVEIIQIPSIMGSDEYSDSLLTGSKAGANFSVYEQGKGRTIQYNVILN
jgi:hypothetical protein